MKKTFAVSFFIICLSALCLAQSSREAIRQDPLKSAGSFYVYDGNALPDMTPAPKGYKPFYISHFARHGARYCTSEYEHLYNWLSKASEAGVLTDAGKDFFRRYEDYYQKVRYCKGNLTGVGQSQHKLIAEHMFRRFPAVFKGQTHIEAVSTESPRVIMSMWSCLSRLDELDKTLDISANASAKHAPWLQPSLSTNPYLIKGAFYCGAATDAKFREYFNETVPWKEIAARFFTCPEVVEDVLKIKPVRFIDVLHSVVTCTRCLDEDQGCFDDVFSQEELYLVWKALSAKYFLDVANFEGSENLILDYAAFTIGQIIETADADIASGSTHLRLRFGHDSGIAPLFIVLDANGCGRAATTLEESLEIFPSYNLPMGANLQIIFYRKSGKPTLVKVLMNEQEVTLPLEPVQGPYYKWDDFKAHFLPIVEASKSKILRKAINSTVVFAEGSDSCHFYRIPAMCLDKRGNIVAVTDRRYESLADLGYRNTSIDIGVKRSTDGGRTWSKQTFIARGDTNRVAGFGYGDASLTLLPDGRIICLFACGNGPKGFRRGFKATSISTSDDGGITWTSPRHIPFPDSLHSAFITSGKGICDSDGDILLAADVLPRDYPDPMPVPWPIEVHLFYSKDGGESWTLQPEPLFYPGDETKLVLLPDGRLLSSSRRWFYGPRGINTAVKGSDGIWHWEGERLAEGLDANPCNGDIVLWQDGLLLHSYIKEAKSRRGLTLAVSADNGASWKDILTLQPGPAAYSTMVVFRNGDVGVLYEDGSRSPDNGYDIVFSRSPCRFLRRALL